MPRVLVIPVESDRLGIWWLLSCACPSEVREVGVHRFVRLQVSEGWVVRRPEEGRSHRVGAPASAVVGLVNLIRDREVLQSWEHLAKFPPLRVRRRPRWHQGQAHTQAARSSTADHVALPTRPVGSTSSIAVEPDLSSLRSSRSQSATRNTRQPWHTMAKDAEPFDGRGRPGSPARPADRRKSPRGGTPGTHARSSTCSYETARSPGGSHASPGPPDAPRDAASASAPSLTRRPAPGWPAARRGTAPPACSTPGRPVRCQPVLSAGGVTPASRSETRPAGSSWPRSRLRPCHMSSHPQPSRSRQRSCRKRRA